MSGDFWLGVLAAALGPLAIAFLWWLGAWAFLVTSESATFLALHRKPRDYRTRLAAYAYGSERAWIFGFKTASVVLMASGGDNARLAAAEKALKSIEADQ